MEEAIGPCCSNRSHPTAVWDAVRVAMDTPRARPDAVQSMQEHMSTSTAKGQGGGGPGKNGGGPGKNGGGPGKNGGGPGKGKGKGRGGGSGGGGGSSWALRAGVQQPNSTEARVRRLVGSMHNDRARMQLIRSEVAGMASRQQVYINEVLELTAAGG